MGAFRYIEGTCIHCIGCIKIQSINIITSHAGVGRTTSLGWHPVDVLAWILDVTGLAVDAVLCVDLKSHPLHSVFPLHILVHPGRTVVLLWASVCGQVFLHGHCVILQRQVGWLVVVVIRSRERHRGQKVETNLSVWLGVFDWFAVPLWLEGGVVFAMVFECPRLFALEQPGEEGGVGYASQVAQPRVEGGTDISHHHQLLPHPALLHTLLVVLQIDTCMHVYTQGRGRLDVHKLLLIHNRGTFVYDQKIRSKSDSAQVAWSV